MAWWRRHRPSSKARIRELEHDYRQLRQERNRLVGQVANLQEVVRRRETDLAAAKEAARDLGAGKQAAEDRLERIATAVADDQHPPEVRLAHVHQLLTEAQPAEGVAADA